MKRNELLEIGKLIWAGMWAAAILWPTAATIARKGWSAVITILVFIVVVSLIVLVVWVMISCIDRYYDWDYQRRQAKRKKR